MQDTTLILLAAGDSTRFNSSVKKQWMYQGDLPLWLYVAKQFEDILQFSQIIIAGHKDELHYMEQFADYTYVAGGNTRQESVQNALSKVSSRHVLINDIARCCIDPEMITRILEQKENASCIVPSLKVSDTLYMDSNVTNRDNALLIQTPQLCLTSTIQEALKTDKEFTDESSAIKSLGQDVIFVAGSTKAQKITYSSDLTTMSCLKAPSQETFVGFGIDTHAYEPDKQMRLCGIDIDSPVGLKAHSDGDVAIHALIDALLGAASMGDIGEWFPDTETKYSNANSVELLTHIVNKINSFGFSITNIDMTIMAEKPKLMSYKQPMQTSIAKALEIEKRRVNIKATTAEKLGFIGREEGITVHAVASLKYYDWRTNI